MSSKPKVSGSVVAGFPSPAEQYQETPLDLNELLVKRPAATFFVKVQGESMIDAGIHDGDLLVVDRSLRPASREVAPVRRRGRLQRPLRQGQGILRSALAYARLGSLESRAPLARRLRRGSGRPLVEDEARQALEAPHHPMGRVDGSEVKSALTEG